MGKEIWVTAAVTGSHPTREKYPQSNIPYSPAEIIQAAIDSYKAGAAIAHIHVRNPLTGEPDFKIDYFKRILEGIREKTDMIVNLTTSGLFLNETDIINKRLKPIYLQPDLASLDVGSMNMGDKIFQNPFIWSFKAAQTMLDRGVKPEIEVFDTGHLAQALELIQKGLIKDPPYFQLCMGVRWGIEATAEGLIFMRDRLPPKAVWSVLGVGSKQYPMLDLAIHIGADGIRVGYEDSVRDFDGRPVNSNAQLVEKAVTLAINSGRKPVTAARARVLLDIK